MERLSCNVRLILPVLAYRLITTAKTDDELQSTTKKCSYPCFISHCEKLQTRQNLILDNLKVYESPRTVLGLGVACVDVIATVDQFPKPDDKVRGS